MTKLLDSIVGLGNNWKKTDKSFLSLKWCISCIYLKEKLHIAIDREVSRWFISWRGMTPWSPNHTDVIPTTSSSAQQQCEQGQHILISLPFSIIRTNQINQLSDHFKQINNTSHGVKTVLYYHTNTLSKH